MDNETIYRFRSSSECQKNKLYRLETSNTVTFTESHKTGDTEERVQLIYKLENGQYGVYAYEYRSPGNKDVLKAADIFACVVDDSNRTIRIWILDVKRNISAFDEYDESGVMTAIKEVRHFVEQINNSVLHKNAFLLNYCSAYSETERVGIVTTKFESGKFQRVADYLEKILSGESNAVSALVRLKTVNNLRSYASESVRLQNFAKQIIKIGEKDCNLHVFILTPIDHKQGVSEAEIAV